MIPADRALLIAGGSHAHDFDATATSLAALLADHGLTTDVVVEPDDAWVALRDAPEPYRLLVVNGLRFTMAHPRYDELRPRWAYRTPPLADEALDRHLRLGLPVLCTHTGCICFDDWDRWSEMLGRQWSWDEHRPSWHPERGPLTVEPRGAAPFALTDEVYTDLVDRGEVEVLASCNGQVVTWRRTHHSSRVGVSTLGHGPDSYAHPGYRALVDGLVGWLLA